ncbi:MAG: NAD(P)H-hydrate dehydratase [Patescibacteria group bacterium]
MLIKTSDTKSVKTFLNKLTLPKPNSHKGQNGRVLIIGGSSLFHSASLWAAEIASYFVDMVHYSSTKENEEIFLSLKKKFRNGMIVPQEKLMEYVKEDDAILVGPGMLREGEEAKYTFDLIKSLIENFPEKQFVFDAGALQMMKPEWLLNLKKPAVITPHQKEFEKLFGQPILNLTIEEKTKIVEEAAKKYKTIILLKAIVDIISDGKETYVIEGGNAGLTKGGTGDILAGLTTALSSTNPALISAVSASILLKVTANKLFQSKGYWYNVGNVIELIPEVLNRSIIKVRP